MKYYLAILLLFSFCSIKANAGDEWVVIHPVEYEYALRNPLKGFRPDANPPRYKHNYAGVVRCYIKWNEIENYESDGIDKIKSYCNAKWAGIERYNIKVIPRVYLDWSSKSGDEYWPADMATGDYSSDQFKKRLERLIQRLGQCWNNDPRVAWVQMGIIGYWGEHHHPSPSKQMQQLMGQAFREAFPDKKVLVRHPWVEFSEFHFGGYWDSWAHINQMETHGAGIIRVNNSDQWWKENIWEGECAYNWGGFEKQPGADPDDTLSDPVHRDFLIDTIRRLHCTALGWVANYNQNDPIVLAGAEQVQKAFGYRYLLNEVRYPAELLPGQEFSVSFKVTNVGSAPFYYNWPVEISLLDPKTRSVVWKDIFVNCDITKWLPGDKYNAKTRRYEKPAIMNNVSGTFMLPNDIAKGEYVVALAILDPAGMLPAVRLATINYFKGGRHPFGMAGVGVRPKQYELSTSVFDDPGEDKSLHYSLVGGSSVRP